MLEVIRSPKIYDVCIIGSGAAGGAAAKVLTEGGVSVVMLEAGPPLDPAKDFKEHLWPYDLAHRGGGVGGKLRARRPTSSWRQTAPGKLTANPMCWRRGPRFAGSVRGSSVGAPITGAESRCASLRWISNPVPEMGWATTGRLPMRNWLLSTTKSSPTSG